MERTQMTFYASFWEAIGGLPKKDQLPVLRAVIAYGLYGSHEEKLSTAQNALFTLMKPNLDASRKKAVSGRNGGSKAQANDKQTASKAQANDKQTASEKEREKEREKENEIENECYMGQSGVCLPLIGGTEYAVPQALVNEFVKLYPAVDVMQQLRNMRGWLLANPSNRKTESGINRFMNTWLSKEQNRARPAKGNAPIGRRQPDADEMEAIRRILEEDYA